MASIASSFEIQTWDNMATHETTHAEIHKPTQVPMITAVNVRKPKTTWVRDRLHGPF